jgi:hypothetical protein
MPREQREDEAVRGQTKTASGLLPKRLMMARQFRRSGGWALLGLVASASALGLAALGPILFLNANEPKPTAIFTDDTGSLDTLVESP